MSWAFIAVYSCREFKEESAELACEKGAQKGLFLV